LAAFERVSRRRIRPASTPLLDGEGVRRAEDTEAVVEPV
jgi:hypothetical protein